ncbi:hypothetical protein Tco_0218670 [Tanacetum coccineum]
MCILHLSSGQPITGPLILLDVVVLAKQVWCNYLNNDLKKRIVVFAGGFNRNTKLGSKEILLLSYVLAVLTLAAVLPNLDMEMDERAQVLTTNVWTERLQSSQEWTEWNWHEAPEAVQKAIEASPVNIGGRGAVVEEKRSINSKGKFYMFKI